MPRLRPGEPAPRFDAVDQFGAAVSLAALRGRPVMLSFYRYAGCPLCNLRVGQLLSAHAELADRRLAMVAVFQSPAEVIARHVGRQDAPFPIVPDPGMGHYRAWGVETGWLAFLASAGRAADIAAAFRRGFLPGRVDGPIQRLPADFLIAPDGSLAVCHYGRDAGDHLPLADIRAFLDDCGRRPEWQSAATPVPTSSTRPAA